MADSADEHRRLILDQFTRQAVPFSQMRDHSPGLILTAAEVRADDTVLDVACGPGLMACAFAPVARHVTGIDLTPAMIERAKNLQRSTGQTNLTWRIGDVLPLPFADFAFSLVFTRYSFHHFQDPKAVLAEMVRVCAPGGRVIVVDVFTSTPEQGEAFNRMEKLRDPSHVRALALHELTELFQEAELADVRTEFYKHRFELEQVLQGSFPHPGDADRVRRLFHGDLDTNCLGLGAYRKDGQLHFAYPIVILIGRVADDDLRSQDDEETAENTGNAEAIATCRSGCSPDQYARRDSNKPARALKKHTSPSAARHKARHFHEKATDPDLRRVLDAWSSLPTALRAGILAMIDSTRKDRNGT